MSIFQIIILIAIAIILYKAIVRLKNKQISIYLFLVWLGLWIVVAVIDIYPIIITKIAFFVGIGRGVDLIIYSSIFILFYVIFRMHLKITGLENKLTKIIRKNAEQRVESKNEK